MLYLRNARIGEKLKTVNKLYNHVKHFIDQPITLERETNGINRLGVVTFI